MMTGRIGVGVAIALSAAAARGLARQPSTRCAFQSDRMAADSTAAGQVVFVGGNVVIRCPSRGITLRGDSAERYPDHDYVIGHVVYDEPRFHVTSDYLNYFPDQELIRAVGNVNARLPSGSTLVGPFAEYRRPLPSRPRRQVFARLRPTITMIEKDSVGRPAPPMTVVADQVFMDGDSLIYAWGEVVITRPQLGATADSAFIDQGRETMRLMRKPEIIGKKDRTFTLHGDLLDLFSKNHKLQRVIARANAIAVSDSMTLKSDTIDLRVENDVLDHAYAWGAKSRASVVSPQQNMLADSLDVSMPGQKIRRVRAVRKAFAQGRPDTTRFHVESPDTTNWIRGDTINASFDSLPSKDTSKTPAIKRLVAIGHASSLYHLAPSDSAERRPAINYSIARTITIDFDQQRVATVSAVDSVSGYYLDPTPDSTTKRPAATTPPGKAPPKAGVPSIVPLPPKKP